MKVLIVLYTVPVRNRIIDSMHQRGLFISGAALLLFGALLPLLAHRGLVSDIGLTPFDVAADLSGSPMRVVFIAQHSASYSVSVALTLPPGATEDSGLICLIQNADADRDNFCKDRGRLDSLTAVAIENDGAQWRLNEPESSIDLVHEGPKITVIRNLGYFDVIAGRRYVVIARLKSDSSILRQLKPRLVAFVNDPGIYESIALSNLIFITALVIGGLSAIGGVSLLSLAYKRSSGAAPT